MDGFSGLIFVKILKYIILKIVPNAEVFDEKAMSTLTGFLTGSEKIVNILAWTNALLPVDVITFILVVTGVYYLFRYTIGLISKIISLFK